MRFRAFCLVGEGVDASGLRRANPRGVGGPATLGDRVSNAR